MTPLDVNLQQLIDAIDTDLPDADELAKVGEAQQRAHSLSDIGDQLIDHFVGRARADGTPWSKIGEALGVTKQAAQQRWVPPVFQGYTDRARHVVVRALEHARRMRRGYVGSEHLLLGLLDEPEGAAAQVLARLAGSVDAMREAVLDAAPVGDANPPSKIPFTPHGKEVLGQAQAASTRMGHNYVGTEHLLLGIAKVDDSTGARVLRQLGAGYDELLTAVVEWITQYVADNPRAAARIAAAKERAAARGIRLDVAGDADSSADC
jgi:hypothetical protein